MPKFFLEHKVREGGREIVKSRTQVEDGLWVAHVTTGHMLLDEWDDDDTGAQHYSEREEYRYRIIGPEPHDRHVLEASNSRHTRSGLRSSQGSCSIALVGKQSFGAILFTTSDGVEAPGLHFVCSRQVHKGELGRRPEIKRPRFAREAPVSDAEVSFRTERPIRRRDQRRGQVGWARLEEAAQLIGMKPEELVRRYFRFTHAEHPALEVRWADGFAEINRQPAKPTERFGPSALDALFARGLGKAWIRKGFACTALYLHHLGHVPEPWGQGASTLQSSAA